MENAEGSLFKGADININNSQNNEEEEDLEDQMRRREELQNLLTAALDDFKYDDSTINSSSNVSLTSTDGVQQNYKNATTPHEQLQVLYEVRVREIKNLREEYEKYKEETKKDVNSLKNKLILGEAEMRQVQISLKNSESLLVEKTDTINKLHDELECKNNQIKNYEKTVANYEIEVSTYQSQLNELHLKLQSCSGPFNLNAKFNSEELQKNFKNKIAHLENKLEEEVKRATILEKEKNSLKEELHVLLVQKEELRRDSENIIKSITKTLESAQQQCKDLINVVEMLHRENEHFKERLKEFENNVLNDLDGCKRKSLDNETLVGHVEKLKKMLLDRSIEIDTLKAKLKYYEDDLKELIEYRQMKCDVYKKEFNQCDNPTHTKDLLIMQNDLQNYRRTIDDKNQQILNLNSINKELQGKIEEMILQTRTEIQNLSHKYNVPQLEVMSVELRNAENKIEQLSQELQKSEERRLSLLKKLDNNKEIELKNQLQKATEQISEVKKMFENEKKYSENLLNEMKALQSELSQLSQLNKNLEIENLKLSKNKQDTQVKDIEWDTLKNEYERLKEQLNHVMKHLAKTKEEKELPEIVVNLKTNMDEFLTGLNRTIEKSLLEEKINSWKTQLDTIDVDKHLKTQFKEAVANLHETENKLKELQENVEEISNAKIIMEGEKHTLLNQLKDFETKWEQSNKTLMQFKTEIINLNQVVKQKDESVINLRDNVNTLTYQVDELKAALAHTDNNLKISEESRKELNVLIKHLQKEVETLKYENLQLQNDVTEAGDGAVKRSLENELKAVEKDLTQGNSDEVDNAVESEYLKKCLQTEMVKCELKLRDEIQIEYQKRIQDIEKRYQNTCTASNELNKLLTEKLENQEKRYREHFRTVLDECENRIKQVNIEKQELIRQINLIQSEFDEYKRSMVLSEHKYVKLVTKIASKAEKNVDAWKKWSAQFMTSCIDIEETNKKTRDNILLNMTAADLEIAEIEKNYNSKMLKYIKKKQNK